MNVIASILRRFLVLVVVVGGASGCAISTAEEIAMGREAAPTLEKQFGGLYPDPRVQSYVHNVGMQMAEAAGRPELPWQFRVVNSDDVNAFALPGGFVYITKGLLFRLDNEAELASVLGHEAAHVAHRDSVRQINRTRGTNVFSTAAGVVGGLFGIPGVGLAAGAAGTLSLRSYSREQEEDADLATLGYLAANGYNPRAMLSTMETLQTASGRRSGPQFLSTHPNPGNRMEYLRETIEEKFPAEAIGGRYGTEAFRRNVPVAAHRPVQ